MAIDTDNLTTLSDTDLGSLLTAALAEQSRRSTLATAVQSVTQTAQQFVDIGGDKTSLVTAIQDLTPQAEKTAS
ncbi:Uncharacterised protein [Acidipropionibacterium jensenii]|uniref:Uncharacterized protein n=1 Tax=Acidipropionibacterium jensenii TaxID=1749 RepID=A0A3S4VKR7_9ACTN|nr:hypothetical protein [Acidipropionibacterium jensenii]VEI04093.1 Uncharacterised protein [Acidipropionibacterium jensenii]